MLKQVCPSCRTWNVCMCHPHTSSTVTFWDEHPNSKVLSLHIAQGLMWTHLWPASSRLPCYNCALLTCEAHWQCRAFAQVVKTFCWHHCQWHLCRRDFRKLAKPDSFWWLCTCLVLGRVEGTRRKVLLGATGSRITGASVRQNANIVFECMQHVAIIFFAFAGVRASRKWRQPKRPFNLPIPCSTMLLLEECTKLYRCCLHVKSPSSLNGFKR